MDVIELFFEDAGWVSNAFFEDFVTPGVSEIIVVLDIPGIALRVCSFDWAREGVVGGAGG